MKNKKLPLRSCVVSKERLLKQEMVRVVRTPNNEVVVDLTGKVNGHGAYLKKDLQIFEKAKKNKILDRYLKIEVNNDIYDELEKLVK